MALRRIHSVIEVEIEQWTIELNEIRDLIENGQAGIVGYFESHAYADTKITECLQMIDLALSKLDTFIAGPCGGLDK